MPSVILRAVDTSDGDKGPALIIVSTLFTSVAFVTTILRLWVRRTRRLLGSDDYTMAAAMVLTVVEAALTIQAVTRGKGKRTKFLHQSDIEYINKYSWIAQIVLFPAMALVKVSVCLLITRINDSRKLRWLTTSVIVVLAVASLEVVVVLLAQCKPVSASWRPKSGKCWPTEVRIYSIYVQAGCSIVTDLICSLLPIAIMWKIQLPLKKKISICGLMAIGLVCTACSTVRAKSLNSKSTDIAYEYATVGIWAMTELSLGVIAPNLGLSRSMYHEIRGQYSAKPHSSRKLNYSYGSRSLSGYSRYQQAYLQPGQAMSGSSVARSEDSEIQLRSVIEKTTDRDVH